MLDHPARVSRAVRLVPGGVLVLAERPQGDHAAAPAASSSSASRQACGRSTMTRWPQSATIRSFARSRRAYSNASSSGSCASRAPQRTSAGHGTLLEVEPRVVGDHRPPGRLQVGVVRACRRGGRAVARGRERDAGRRRTTAGRARAGTRCAPRSGSGTARRSGRAGRRPTRARRPVRSPRRPTRSPPARPAAARARARAGAARAAAPTRPPNECPATSAARHALGARAPPPPTSAKSRHPRTARQRRRAAVARQVEREHAVALAAAPAAARPSSPPRRRARAGGAAARRRRRRGSAAARPRASRDAPRAGSLQPSCRGQYPREPWRTWGRGPVDSREQQRASDVRARLSASPAPAGFFIAGPSETGGTTNGEPPHARRAFEGARASTGRK